MINGSLSGIVSMQVIVYFEVYRNDRYAIKSLVCHIIALRGGSS